DGYFVALPGRDEMLVLPVTSTSLPQVHLLKVLAEKNFKNAPYPISDDVFWIRDGVWRLFPMSVKNEQVTVTPPQEFLELLKRFMPDAEVSDEDSKDPE